MNQDTDPGTQLQPRAEAPADSSPWWRRRLGDRVLLAGVGLGFIGGLIFASLLGLWAPSGPSLFNEDAVQGIYEVASPAVVEIEVDKQIGGLPFDIPAWGSGFLIDSDGHIVTNYHVVSDGSNYLVRLADGRELDAVRLGFSQADDIALIKVDADEVSHIEPLKLSDSSKVTPGQLAIAIGSPFREFNSVGVGVVSGTARDGQSVLNRPIPDMIQTDVPLNRGNSGGPLLNSDGEVIGINSQVRIEQQSGEVEDFRIGFAVPSNTLTTILPELLESKDLRRPWIGIQGTAVPRDLKESRDFPRGIFVTGVFANSPARRAGLNPFRNMRTDVQGDIITAVDSLPVGSVEEMVGYLNSKQPGDVVTVTVFRNGAIRTVDLKLDPWPDGA